MTCIIAEISNMSTENSGKQHIASRLVEERTRLGHSQKEMAKICDVGFRTYCEYEAGGSEPRGTTLAALVGAGADVLYILTGRHMESVLSPDETLLITGFRGMDSRGKAAALAMVAGYIQQSGPALTINGSSIGQVVQGDAAGGGTVTPPPTEKKRR